MRSKISKKILDETPQEVKDKVNKYTNELILHNVSQQRELLEAFVKQIKEDNEFVDEITFQDINKCLASNCGSAITFILSGLHYKYECPNCGEAPDIVRPNIQKSRCFKCKLEWEYE